MIELNKIYNEDCLELLSKIDDNSVDLILTSPPYNIGIDYDNYNDNINWNDYYKWCKSWLQECYRVLKKDGRIALNHYISLGNSSYRTSPISNLYCIMNDIGFKHHAISIWNDITLAKATAWGSWLSASSPYINSPFEGIIIDYKEQWKKETKGLTKANFSIDIAEKIIKLLTYKNDIVLDIFMGSGTTAVACKLNDRNFIGSEISNKYCTIANNRLLNTSKQLSLFDL